MSERYPSERPDPSELSKRAWRVAGLGTEMAGGIAGFVLLGWWIDRQFGTSPTWLIVGAVLGGVGGLVHLIKRALELQREDQASRKAALSERKPDGAGSDDGPHDTHASG